MCLCVERGIYLGGGDTIGRKKAKRNAVKQRKILKEKVDSCFGGCELFRVDKQSR